MRNLLFIGMALAVGCSTTKEEVGPHDVVIAGGGDYSQIFGNAQHAGNAGIEQTGLHVVATIEQETLQQTADRLRTSGFLQAHYPPPLVRGDFVVIPTTSNFTEPLFFFEKSTVKYGLKALRWLPSVSSPNATLAPIWTIDDVDGQGILVDGAFCSFGCQTNGYEALYAPAIANGSVYAPAKSGRLVRYDLATGARQAVIDPLAGTPFSGDAVTTVTSPVTASASTSGTIYYTVTAWAANTTARGTTPRGSWLVRVAPDDTTVAVPWANIATAELGVPQFPGGLCTYQFGTGGTPGPTSSASKAPQFNCGLQRPGLNVPVSIDHNGNLAVISYANNQWAAAFMIRIDAQTLRPIVASDFRGHALHGCGVRLSGGFNECSSAAATCDTITDGGTTHLGFDACTNEPVPVFGPDLDSTAITVAPNGDMSWGSYDGGFVYGGEFDARGFGMTFRRDGGFIANNGDYYWDITPGVISTPNGFRYIAEHQQYSDFATKPLGIAKMNSAWQVESKGVVDRDPNLDPNITPIDFVTAQPLFDTSGAYYATNSDGHLYKWSSGGQLLEVVDLVRGDMLNAVAQLQNYGARDSLGRIYLPHGGAVYVIQGGGPQLSRAKLTASAEQTAGLNAGRTAKLNTLHQLAAPTPPN